jgi:hypothetical protein
MLIACITFIVPTTLKINKESNKPVENLMDWQTMHEKMTWGPLLLIGGGYALAEASMVGLLFGERTLLHTLSIFLFESL